MVCRGSIRSLRCVLLRVETDSDHRVRCFSLDPIGQPADGRSVETQMRNLRFVLLLVATVNGQTLPGDFGGTCTACPEADSTRC